MFNFSIMDRSEEVKKVEFYPPAIKRHTAYRTYVSNPPRNYQFSSTFPSGVNIKIGNLRKYNWLKKFYKLFIKRGSLRAFDIVNNPKVSEEGIDIIYSIGVIYKGNLPYVLEILDNPISLAGYNYSLFIKNRESIEKALENKRCKAIVCANESALNMLKKYFSKKVVRKCTVIKTGVELPEIKEKQNNGATNILFMGSITNPEDFYIKGGLEAIESFNKIKSPAKLIVRCRVDEDIRAKILKNPNITLLEQELPFENIKNLYRNADIFILPGHT